MVIGNNDNEHGPRLVKSPAIKIKKKVNSPGLLRACPISKLPLLANSAIARLISKIILESLEILTNSSSFVHAKFQLILWIQENTLSKGQQ